MAQVGLAEVLGVKGKSIQWERPLFFFAALIIGQAVWWVLAPTWETSPETGTAIRLFQIRPAWLWLMVVLNHALLAALALAAFRFIRNTVIAVAAVVVTYSPLCALSYAFFLPRAFEHPLSIPWTSFMVDPAVRVCLFLGALALALCWLRPTWLALLVGAIAGLVAASAVFIVLALVHVQRDLAEEVGYFPFYLLEMALFAGVVWVGLWLSSDQPAETGAKPRLRKGYYVETSAVALGLPLLLSVAFVVLFMTKAWAIRDIIPSLILLGMAGLLLIYGGVVFWVLVYRMWAAIQDGHARTSPGPAVGLLFVPVYNVYWVFQVFPGFAKDFNAFASRHSLNAPRLSTGVFVAYAVLVVAAIVPWVEVFVSPVFCVVTLLMVSRICDAVNALPRTLPGAASSLAA